MALPQGKLIKKHDKVLSDKSLEVQEYPWLEFTQESIVFTDNPRKNIIRKDFHDPAEISSKITVPESFTRPLGLKTKPLVPLDLTEDYKANLAEAQVRKRKRLMDEDEIFSLELAELDVPGHQVDERWSRKEKAKGSTEKRAREAETSPQNEDSRAEKKSDIPTAPLTTFSPNPNLQEAQSLHLSAEDAESKLKTLVQQAQSASSVDIEDLKNKAWEESYEAGFKQGYEEGAAQGETAGRVEGLELGKAEGKNEGFDAGFRDGEERGGAALESKSNKYFSTLAQALTEIDKLKNEILASGQDIFMELAKICCEKVVRDQLRMSDESLRKIFETAVETFADKDRLSVEMNPSDAQRLQKMMNEQGKAARVKVKENSALEPGDFKVEADHEIVTVDVKKALELLLENLRGELFSEQNNSAQKAG